ncbi:MAG: phosphotransferase [Yaniella sp.]|nr:phosphotransferase [Yaniella sp.]
MKRTAMELAALASAAMPGLDIVQATASPDDQRAFDSAIVTDSDNNHWRVRSPRNSQAAFRLETEIQVLSGFTPAIRAHLPFRVPSVAGAVQIDSLRTFIYHQMPGQPAELDAITGSETQTIDDIGRIVAAIHQLPRAVVETADLPSYGAEQLRSRLLSELDQIALTGKVPSALLRRWENAFEERRMWSFTPRVVHGDFDETSLLIDRNRAVGVTAWTDLHIGDPAQDFTWLASTESIEFREALLSAYHQHMDLPADQLDLHIMRRAALAAEFSLAKYLMSGINASDNEVVAEAQAMLDELASDVEATGGQDIGQKFWEPEPTPEPSAQTTAPVAPAETESAIVTDNEI